MTKEVTVMYVHIINRLQSREAAKSYCYVRVPCGVKIWQQKLVPTLVTGLDITDALPCPSLAVSVHVVRLSHEKSKTRSKKDDNK